MVVMLYLSISPGLYMMIARQQTLEGNPKPSKAEVKLLMKQIGAVAELFEGTHPVLPLLADQNRAKRMVLIRDAESIGDLNERKDTPTLEEKVTILSKISLQAPLPEEFFHAYAHYFRELKGEDQYRAIFGDEDIEYKGYERDMVEPVLKRNAKKMRRL